MLEQGDRPIKTLRHLLSLVAGLEDVLQRGEIPLEFAFHRSLDERVGKLEESPWLALDRDGDPRACALRLNRLLNMERHRAGGDLKDEFPRRLKRLDPHSRFHTPAKELAYLLAARARLQRALDSRLERPRLPFMRVRRIRCVGED